MRTVCRSCIAATALEPPGAQSGTFQWPTLPRLMAVVDMSLEAAPIAVLSSAQDMALYFEGSITTLEAQPADEAKARKSAIPQGLRAGAFMRQA